MADAKPAFLDIVRLAAASSEGVLSLEMSLAAPAPASSPLVGVLAYRFYLDTGDNGDWDHVVALELAPEGGYVPSLLDRSTGDRLAGPGYPGSANLAGGQITMTLRLEAVGNPSAVGVRAASEQIKGGATVRDDVPDAPGEWIRVETNS